jgi:hypothetical protein
VRFSRKTTVLALAILMVVLMSASPVRAVVKTKSDVTTLSDWRGTFQVKVTGYYHTGETEFFKVKHEQSVSLNFLFVWHSGSWSAKGLDGDGEIYDEEFTIGTSSYLYDDEPYVNNEAFTNLYGIVYWWGMPAGGPINITAEIKCEPPW